MASKVLRKIDLMHKHFGKCDGHACRECSNLISGRYHDRILTKCQVYGMTHSEASDWAKRWQACGMFNKPYSGPPMMRAVKRRTTQAAPKESEEPLEGQMMLEV